MARDVEVEIMGFDLNRERPTARTDVVKIKGRLGTAEIVVNGLDVSKVVAGYHVRHSHGEVPTVELVLIGAHQFDGPARVEIQPELRTALIALGWTAPA